MELGESTSEGAARETFEEAGAHIKMGSLFTVMSVPRVGQVHLYFLAELENEQFDPGFETQEARMFSETEIPWDDLAFRTVQETLKHYFADKKSGSFGVHTLNID
jgi:ADP-ribose pyrophosphatase YjhB (NUDIX family)